MILSITNFSYRKRLLLALIVCLIMIGMGILHWMETPYAFTEPRHVATDFLQLVKHNEYEKAYALTLQNGYTGQTLDEFRQIAAREICADNLQIASLHPLQTNGNRLRREINGKKVEMPLLDIEFSSSTSVCLFSISMHYIGDGNWKIFKFGAHAG